MKFVVDRVEGDYAVCENCDSKEMSNLEKAIFPEDIQAGTLFELIDGVVAILPNEETHERIKEKMDKLWK